MCQCGRAHVNVLGFLNVHFQTFSSEIFEDASEYTGLFNLKRPENVKNGNITVLSLEKLQLTQFLRRL